MSTSGKRDYYEVLGVSKTSSSDEIRKAYKQLALTNHPDRNPGDAAAEARFREATEAYSVLSDDDKKGRYDQFGHAGLEGGGGGFGGEDIFSHFQDLFSEFFGGFGGQQRQQQRGPKRGHDVCIQQRLSLKDAVLGCKREISVRAPSPCEACDGSGAARDDSVAFQVCAASRCRQGRYAGCHSAEAGQAHSRRVGDHEAALRIGRNAIVQAENALGGAVDASFLRYAAEIAYGHHERWDGSGYPEGLSGEAIPVSARLRAVADVYDALISRRVYKPPFPHEQAIEMMFAEKGSHFDPDIVDALMLGAGDFAAIARNFSDESGSEDSASSE